MNKISFEVEVKDCPCCGGVADIKYTNFNNSFMGNYRGYYVACTECGVRTGMFYDDKEDICKLDFIINPAVKAVKIWNTRPSPGDVVFDISQS